MKKFFKNIGLFFTKVFIYFLIISVLSVVLFRFVPVFVTPLMLIRCIQQVMDGKDIKMEKDWVSLEEVSPHLQLAVVCAEDQNFIHHHGFDFKAIEKAMKYNEKSRRKRGASTISQQTAKNVFLWPGRSWIRKGFEVYFTALIELIWSKERIMEVYLNVAETGNGIYGAEAASKRFFRKPAKKLSRAESALIAAVLPNPRKWSPARPTGYILSRQVFILRQMTLWGGQLKYNDVESEGGFVKKK